MAAIWINRNEPGDNRLYLIDEDFTIGDLPTILGPEDRVGCMVCTKNMSAFYVKNTTGWTQVSDTSASSHMFQAKYGVTTWQEVHDAYYDKKVCFVLHPTENYLGMLIEESDNGGFCFTCPKSHGNLVMAVGTDNHWSNTWYSMHEKAGDGITVSHSSTIGGETTIKANIDDNTIKFNNNGQMYVNNSVEKAWVLKGNIYGTETERGTIDTGIDLDLTNCTELYIVSLTNVTSQTNLYLSNLSVSGNITTANKTTYGRFRFFDGLDGIEAWYGRYNNDNGRHYNNTSTGYLADTKIAQLTKASFGNSTSVTSCDIKIYAR